MDIERVNALDDLAIKFVSNDKEEGTKVLKVIQNELTKCDEFSLSVAFITLGGVTMFANQLLSLKQRNIKGRILTSTYQMFNDPKVYQKLLTFPNIEVRVYSAEDHHTKGYIFRKDEHHNILIGSSNLTQNALAVNREWNLEVDQSENSELVKSVMSEFEKMWESASVANNEWIQKYSLFYEESKKFFREPRQVQKKITSELISPNKMQMEALRNIKALRNANEKKALLISATGTGKTYLSAFDVRESGMKKVLFVIHREQIARDAEKTFKKVMPERTTGFISGTRKDFESDIIFTTIQSISLDHNLNKFSSEHFDYIVYDEAHHNAADSYQKVMNYFQPKFQLGMTATPERTNKEDINIFELFDYNIAYEIRLQDALEQDMLTPFHYFGVSDVTSDGTIIDDQSTIAQLVSQHRIDIICEKAEYYGFSGDRVKGLIFCSRNEEAKQLSDVLNLRGYRTLALSGSNTQLEREEAIKRLTDNNGDLDYILTVDIFNEGIDIPQVNQIIMLRPTQSAIVFVQQLGRGLRKHDDKDYVVVIDFIGNYKNNFLIPIALSGDRSMSKNNLRKFIMEGNSLMPGVSTIEFDEITKERIYEAINRENFSSVKYLREEYDTLRYRLGRIPRLVDYINHDSVDPQVIFANRLYRNHPQFLETVEKDYNDVLSNQEKDILTFVSLELSNGKRTIELEILSEFINGNGILKNELSENHSKETIKSAIKVLKLEFFVEAERARYNGINLIEEDEDVIHPSFTFIRAMSNLKFVKHMRELLVYGMERHKRNYFNKIEEKDNNDHSVAIGLVVGEQYTRKDACWLLNWSSNEYSTIYGYKVHHETKTIPIFVTYSKSEDISESTNYDDRFVTRDIFNWMSRSNRTIDSNEIQSIINAKENGYKILLFVKRSDGEEKYFYYLGEVSIINTQQTQIHTSEKPLPIVQFTFKLKSLIRDDLYYYFLEA